MEKLVFDRAAASTLYAGLDRNGLFRTTDQAKNWTQTSQGYGGCSPSHFSLLTSLVVDASSPGTLYVADGDSHVCKSTDGGTTWTIVGPAGVRVTMVTTSPTVAGAVYVGAANNDPFTNSTVLLKSVDGGTSWAPLLTGLGRGSAVVRIVESPHAPRTIYAIAGDPYVPLESQLFKTTDGGTSWAALKTGLSPADYSVTDLALDPIDDAKILVLAKKAVAAPVWLVARTSNGGATWESSPLPVLSESGQPRFLIMDSHDAARLFAGPYRSVDGGKTWEQKWPDRLGPLTSAVFDPTGPGIYGATVNNGVFQSLDSGETWQQASRGFPSPGIQRLAPLPSRPLLLYALTENSLVSTIDGGSNWTTSDLPKQSIGGALPSTHFFPYDLKIASGDPFSLYINIDCTALCGSDPDYLRASGLYKSTDGGTTWDRTGLREVPIEAFAIDPVTPTTLHAAQRGGGLTKSTDGGATWSSLVGPAERFSLGSGVIVNPAKPQNIYARLFLGGYVRSLDGGATWEGFEPPGSGVFFDPTAPETLYSPFFKSTNGGATWTSIAGIAGVDITAFVVDPSDPATLYAGTTGGVFRSENGGASWGALNNGLGPLRVNVLTIDASGSRLYVGTEHGIYVYDAPFERKRVTRGNRTPVTVPPRH